MKKETIFLFLIFSSIISYSQNVGIGTTTPDSSAALEIKSSSQGFLPPRMTTTQRNAIANPAVGLQIYNTTTDCLEIFAKGRWQNIYCATAASTPVNTDTTNLTDIDGNAYPTVKICNQTWTAKNLNVSHYRNGDIIPQVTDPTQWASLTTGAWCWYNNDSATYGATYGKLYNWYAVNDARGLTPEGWHVPSDGEWNILVKCLDANSDTSIVGYQTTTAGGAMKEVGTSHWLSPNTGATNISGFAALSCGLRDYNGLFNLIGNYGDWWSATEYSTTSAWYRYLSNNYVGVFRFGIYGIKTYGFSIRCIKDTIPSTLTNGLVAYYPFNGNANDESGNGNNGVVNGATLTTDRFGNVNSAFDFNGSGNSIQVSNSPSLNPSNITLNAWVYGKANLVPYQYILQKQTTASDPYEFSYSMIVMKNNSNSFPNSFQSHYGIGDCNHVSGSAIIGNPNKYSDSTWIMLTSIIQQNGSQRLYINGVLDTTYLGAPFIPCNSPTTQLRIGHAWDGDPAWFKGTIDDIRIYNRALNQEEITYLATH
jgi:hypothetical protein